MRAPVPEIAVVERGVDRRRRLPVGDAAEVVAVDGEHGVGLVGAAVHGAGADEVEAAEEHALRSVDVIGVMNHRRRVVVDVGQPMEREIVARRSGIRPDVTGCGAVERSVAAGVQRVRRPIVAAGVEVTARARLTAVAAGLHVPEERLAEDDSGVVIADVARDRRGRRGPDALQEEFGFAMAVGGGAEVVGTAVKSRCHRDGGVHAARDDERRDRSTRFPSLLHTHLFV